MPDDVVNNHTPHSGHGVVQKPLFSGNTDVQMPPSKSSGFFDQSGVVGESGANRGLSHPGNVPNSV